jgi:predicted DNA-binding transcriptional regulator YafY
VDTIRSAKLLKTKTCKVAQATLDEVLKSGYGIFSGKKTKKARLKFTPERARWVSREDWHPKQKSSFDSEGYYILEVPYSNEHELVMDIMKYGPDAIVVSPHSLKKAVKERLTAALKNYS